MISINSIIDFLVKHYPEKRCAIPEIDTVLFHHSLVKKQNNRMSLSELKSDFATCYFESNGVKPLQIGK